MTRLQFTTLLSSSTLLSYSRQRMLSAIGTILDFLIAFRILFLLVKEVNLLPSRLYILQLSLSTIISGSKNMSLKGLHTPLQCSLYPECSKSISNLSLSDLSSNIKASESSNEFSTWWHTLSLDLSDSDSELSLSVSDSGSIVSKSPTSAPSPTSQQILLSELPDSTFVLLFLTSNSSSRILESLVNSSRYILVDSLSGLGSNLSLESLF